MLNVMHIGHIQELCRVTSAEPSYYTQQSVNVKASHPHTQFLQHQGTQMRLWTRTHVAAKQPNHDLARRSSFTFQTPGTGCRHTVGQCLSAQNTAHESRRVISDENTTGRKGSKGPICETIGVGEVDTVDLVQQHKCVGALLGCRGGKCC